MGQTTLPNVDNQTQLIVAIRDLQALYKIILAALSEKERFYEFELTNDLEDDQNQEMAFERGNTYKKIARTHENDKVYDTPGMTSKFWDKFIKEG